MIKKLFIALLLAVSCAPCMALLRQGLQPHAPRSRRPWVDHRDGMGPGA